MVEEVEDVNTRSLSKQERALPEKKENHIQIQLDLHSARTLHVPQAPHRSTLCYHIWRWHSVQCALSANVMCPFCGCLFIYHVIITVSVTLPTGWGHK